MTDPQNFSAMGDLLKKVMENPELLSGAMSMASALASSGALNGLLGKKPEERTGDEGSGNSREQPLAGLSGISGLSGLMSALGGSTKSQNATSEPEPEHTPTTTQPPAAGARRVGHKERIALLEAMRPFISPEKKDRLELLIRLLGVMEIAEGMGLGK